MFINSSVFSNESTLPDISKMSAQEIEKLPMDVLNKLDAKELYSKMGLSEGIYKAMLNFALYKLFYFYESPDEKFLSEKIMMFQKHINQEETGQLTFEQMNNLLTSATKFNQTRVTPLSGFGEKLELYNWETYFSVKGTFYLEDEQIAYPINKSEVLCRKSLDECEVLMAFVMLPTESDSSDAYYLDFSRASYEILKWDTSEIIAEDVGDCRTTQLVINFNSDEVYEITRNNRTKKCDENILNQLLKSQGEEFPDLDKPRIARLVPGGKLISDYWEERKKKESENFLPAEILEEFKALGNF